MPKWGGRKVATLIAYVVHRDGGICWLCEDGGADSADHDPPRSTLVRLGVPNPDDPIYLHAGHLLCNKRRGTRPVTFELRLELKAKRAADVAASDARDALSPRFARRRPVL